MDIEEERRSPSSPDTRDAQGNPPAGRDSRGSRRPRGDERRGPRPSAGGGGNEDYKPSDSAARRGSSEQGERPPYREGRSPRSGGGGRSSGPDERRGGGGGRSERGGSRGRSEERPAAKPAEPAPTVATAEGGAARSYQEELGGALLASVSRSFSLTIQVLPEGLREPISAGYLLARALDTVADTAKVPVAKRLEHLRALLEMIKYGVDPELLRPLQKDLAARQSHEGERELIEKLDRCLAWLDALPADDQWDLRRALLRVGRGQELDLLRFGEGTGAEPKALANETELDEYTYFVAGCVGELWTRLCERHLPAGWSRLGTDEMLTLGKHFGQGLQMVNILRDLPDDLENGRCYLPETLLVAQGLDAATLVKEPARVRPVIDQLRGETVAKLDDAWKYARSLTPSKMRYACALPVLLGLETLGLVAKTSPLEAAERLKVSKAGMRGVMISSAVGTVLGAWHERQYRGARGRAVKGL